MKNLNCVNRTLKYSHQVSHEAHKLKGFLRFKKMKNHFYYGVINPTNNVLEIIAVHFSKRMKNEAFIIKDDNRKIHALYDKKQIIYLKDKDIIKLNLELDKDEIVFEELWKSFFKTIAINERKNLKTQMNFMPKKYWDYILEMENEK
jgi:probable DNA metabolism protein